MLPNYDVPPRHLEGLRHVLEQAHYSETGICQRLGIPSIFDFNAGANPQGEIEDDLALLIRLFLDGEPLARARIEAGLDEEAFHHLEKLGLVASRVKHPDLWYATAHLYPVEGLYIASDRSTPGDPDLGEPLPPDVVYPAITDNTARFLSILPADPCEECLDLCSGTGIAALVGASRYARHAWATDLGARSVHFAEFNRRLNGLENVTVAQGDLYEAIGDRTFDCILAHPPYVPASRQRLLFRDGGEDGEQILCRMIQDLPRHLRPGGRFRCLTFATDRKDEELEQRIRKWLGECEAQFDVALIAIETQRKPENVLKAVIQAKGKLGELGESSKLFERLGVTALFYGVVDISRHGEPRPAGTGRVQKAKTAGREAIEWFTRWVAASARPGFEEALLNSQLQIASHLSLQVTHRLVDRELVPSEFRVKSDFPFISDANISPWLAAVIGNCDGHRAAKDIYAEMQAQEGVAPQMSAHEFAGYLRLLISQGFLEMPRFPLPVKNP
jgi:methylase of polypeptide subunit release factors